MISPTPTPPYGPHLNLPTPIPSQPSNQPYIHTISKSGIYKPNPKYALHSTYISLIPSNPKSALLNQNRNYAMTNKFNSLLKQNTWNLVPHHHWLSLDFFCHKFSYDGSLERYKARLVVNGKSHEVGVDCDETFSHVVKLATIQTVLCLALRRWFPIHQLDVKNVFLHWKFIFSCSCVQAMQILIWFKTGT